MIFATASLAGRIESAECRLSIAAAETARRRRGDVLIAPLAGGAAIFTGPGEPFNKAIGLGFGDPLDVDALSAVELAFDERATPLQVEIATLADTGLADLLARRGYHLTNFESVLGLALSADVVRAAEQCVSAATADGLGVRRADAEQAREWADVVVTGFAHPDSFDGPASHESFPRGLLERVFGDQWEIESFRQYVALREGELAGGASMRIDSGVAQLCGASTLPAHRRRGVQSTLLRARLVDAAREGCDLAVVTTQPGSKSQENVQRAGFELLYVRAIMIRPVSQRGQSQPNVPAVSSA